MDGAQDIILSTAVTVVPFIDSDGNPSQDVSEFAKVLNYIGSGLLVFPFSSRGFDNVAQMSRTTIFGDPGIPLSDITHLWMIHAPRPRVVPSYQL